MQIVRFFHGTEDEVKAIGAGAVGFPAGLDNVRADLAKHEREYRAQGFTEATLRGLRLTPSEVHPLLIRVTLGEAAFDPATGDGDIMPVVPVTKLPPDFVAALRVVIRWEMTEGGGATA